MSERFLSATRATEQIGDPIETFECFVAYCPFGDGIINRVDMLDGNLCFRCAGATHGWGEQWLQFIKVTATRECSYLPRRKVRAETQAGLNGPTSPPDRADELRRENERLRRENELLHRELLRFTNAS